MVWCQWSRKGPVANIWARLITQACLDHQEMKANGHEKATGFQHRKNTTNLIPSKKKQVKATELSENLGIPPKIAGPRSKSRNIAEDPRNLTQSISDQSVVGEIHDHGRIGQGGGIANGVQLILGNFSQNSPHDFS